VYWAWACKLANFYRYIPIYCLRGSLNQTVSVLEAYYNMSKITHIYFILTGRPAGYITWHWGPKSLRGLSRLSRRLYYVPKKKTKSKISTKGITRRVQSAFIIQRKFMGDGRGLLVEGPGEKQPM